MAQAKLGRWQLSPGELSDVAWALATSRHDSPLVPQLDAALVAAGGAAAATPAELVTLLWAFATLNHTPVQLMQQLHARGWVTRSGGASNRDSSSSSQLGELRGAQLTTLAWSLACLQQVEGVLFRDVWREVCVRGAALLAGADARSLVQLAQAAIAVELEGSFGPRDLHCDAGGCAGW